MSTTAGLISFKAREGKGAEVAERIAAALPHVNAEEGTTHWLVIRSETSPETVFLVDLFSSTDSRELHMSGEAAKQIFAPLPALLAEEPHIHPAVLIAAKGI